MRGLAAAMVTALVLAGPASGQSVPDPAATPVLIIDSERLYQESRYGQQLRDGLDAEAAALKTENDRIVAALTEEERSLTMRRPTLTPEAFRKEAKDFDTKVQGIRRARDAKEVALQNARAAAQRDFFGEVQTVVGQLMLERGAAVTLDQRSVFVALQVADVTDAAIARIDAAFVDAQTSVVPNDKDLLEGPAMAPDPDSDAVPVVPDPPALDP